MILVKTYWNTDHDGVEVPADVELEDMPISFYGPFGSVAEAVGWMNDDYPDGDTDVHEMVADRFDLPAHQLPHINAPSSVCPV